MNLIYVCINNSNYIKLFGLLIKSLETKGNLCKDTDILIITFKTFLDDINRELSQFNFIPKYFIISNTIELSKFQILNYENINKYEKILYLNTDIIVYDDINKILNLDIEDNIIYEKKDIPEYKSGILFFKYSLQSKIKELLNNKTIIYDTKLLNDYILPVYNFNEYVKVNTVIYHFIGGPNNNISKLDKMKHFLTKKPFNYESTKLNHLRNFHNKR
jgi:hypothetical protein